MILRLAAWCLVMLSGLTLAIDGQHRAGAAEEKAPKAETSGSDSEDGRPEASTDSQPAQEATEGEGHAQVELPPELRALRDRVRRCLARYFQHEEDAAYRSPWGIMHTLIAFGVDTEITASGRRYNAIGWLCWNLPCRGMRLFATSGGLPVPLVGPGRQGHEGQFLAMLALSRVPADYGIRANGYEFTIADLVEYEKQTCMAGTELSFKLVGLAHYLKSDATWKNRYGESWGIPRLIKEELAQPVVGSTCGGTHRMMGFSYAVRKREERGEPIEGQWWRAKKYVEDYHAYTFKLQNADGSFSTAWFRGRADYGGIDRHLETTGHILEWLVFSLPQEQLREPRVVRSVDYLTRLLMEHPTYRWEIGPRGHALHALAIYDERVFGSKPGQREFLRQRPQP